MVGSPCLHGEGDCIDSTACEDLSGRFLLNGFPPRNRISESGGRTAGGGEFTQRH